MVIPAGRVLTRRLLFSPKSPLCRLHVLHHSSRLNCLLSNAIVGVRFAATKSSKAKPGPKPRAKPRAKPGAKKTAAKKPAAKKKTTAKKRTTKKAVKKPVKRRKKAVKKPVKKKPKRVVLTPEQKERKEIRALRARALNAPRFPRASGWIAFVSEKKSISPELSKEWAALPAEEKQKYTDKSTATRAAKIKAYEKWVASTPPAAILEANKARARLKRLGVKSRTGVISDPRQVKRPINATIQHMLDQYKSGRSFEGPDGTKMSVVDIMKTCRAEFLALPAQEREKYEEKYKADLERYRKAKAKTYGKEYE